MSRYSYKRFGRHQNVLPPIAPQFGFLGRSSQTAASAAASVPDSDEAASGGHGGGYAITAYDDECCPEVIDITSLLASLGLVAGGALALGGLFQNIFGGGGRKRRSLDPLEAGLESLGIEYVNAVELFFHSGGEESVMSVTCVNSIISEGKNACTIWSNAYLIAFDLMATSLFTVTMKFAPYQNAVFAVWRKH